MSIQDQTPISASLALEDLRLWAPSSAAHGVDAKRLLDITVSLALIVLLLLLLALLTLAVALESRGPVLFCQRRTGRGGRIFGMLKFRSMRVMENDAIVVQATQNDPRITRVGHILRTTSLDELPQLFNVLWGEMSMVGPRPERQFFVDELISKIPYYAVRHSVKPGVTGWAQVRYEYGSTIEDSVEKLQYDLYYVKNHSLFLDLLIMLETVAVVLTGKGAR